MIGGLTTILAHQDAKEPMTGTYERLQRYLHHFWQRFIQEVIPTMDKHQRTQNRQFQEFKEGDIVMYLDPKQKGVWHLAQVAETKPSNDGLGRRIIIQMASNKEYYERHAHDLAMVCPIEKQEHPSTFKDGMLNQKEGNILSLNQ